MLKKIIGILAIFHWSILCAQTSNAISLASAKQEIVKKRFIKCVDPRRFFKVIAIVDLDDNSIFFKSSLIGYRIDKIVFDELPRSNKSYIAFSAYSSDKNYQIIVGIRNLTKQRNDSYFSSLLPNKGSVIHTHFQRNGAAYGEFSSDFGVTCTAVDKL